MNIWTCKIGETDAELPPGSDSPMRHAVEAAYEALTGQESEFLFSGWGGELTEGERAVVEDRLPEHHRDNPELLIEHCDRLAQALRLTQEYVGADMLPPLEGWEWYDALNSHATVTGNDSWRPNTAIVSSPSERKER